MSYLSAMTPRTEYTALIRETGWSLRELARRSGVSLNTLRALSAGRNRKPQLQTRQKLAAALRIHAARMLEVADTLDP